MKAVLPLSNGRVVVILQMRPAQEMHILEVSANDKREIKARHFLEDHLLVQLLPVDLLAD